MKPSELILNAEYIGRLVISRNPFTQLKDLEHYFNSDKEEIGYIAFPRTKFESVIKFDPPRKWNKSFLDKYHLISLKKVTII